MAIMIKVTVVRIVSLLVIAKSPQYDSRLSLDAPDPDVAGSLHFLKLEEPLSARQRRIMKFSKQNARKFQNRPSIKTTA